MTRRGATALSGILPVDKPTGMTSHDVVSHLRRATGERRIGHAGTLDPAATGVLVILIGPATRLEPYLSADTKMYEATIAFGSATDTDDADGEVVRTAPVEPHIFTERHARDLLADLLGESSQRPPAYSAIKVGGKTAHKVMRAGGTIELADRPITVFEAVLLSVDAETGTWRVMFTVSKGTYIRALARDLGERAGSAAHLSELRRTASGTVSLEMTSSLDAAVQSAADDRIESLFVDPVAALGWPTVVSAPYEDVRNGRPLPRPADAVEGSLLAVQCVPEELSALYRVSGDRASAEVVLAVPMRRVV